MNKDAPSATARRPAPRRVLIIDFHVTDAGSRPDRYLDVECLSRHAPGLQVCCAATVATDEELEQRLGRWMSTMASRLLLAYAQAPWVVWRHYFTLRRADVVVCLGPHYFWWMVLLGRLRLLPGKRRMAVRGIFFHTTGFQRKLTLFRAAPEGFQAAFVTRQQIDGLVAEGASATRLRYLPWRIDTTWFRPRASPAAGTGGDLPYVLCPGSARRDEALVNALVGRLDGVKIVRAGRMPALQTVYQAALQRPDVFELRINADHREYLRLLQNAALVILPIVACDEPAGLTAALETLACEVPLLANESAGIGPLLREADVAGRALVSGLDPATWETAIRKTLAERGGQAGMNPWQSARQVVAASYSIGSDDPGIEWLLSPID